MDRSPKEKFDKSTNPDLFYLQNRLSAQGRTLTEVNQDDVLNFFIDFNYDAVPDDFYFIGVADNAPVWARKLYSLCLSTLDLLDTGSIAMRQDKLEFLGSIGHMDMVGLRTTIESSDRVREVLIPDIVKLYRKNRNLKLAQILLLRNEYTKDGGVSASAFKSGKGSRMLSREDDYFSESEIGIRNVIVWGGSFRHPNALSIRSLANRWLSRVNWFLANLDKYSIEEINQVLVRLYVTFSTLHLPLDGSGRLDGDLFELLQQLVADQRVDFQPIPVSTTGFRSYFLEIEFGNTRDEYRSAFLKYFYEKVISQGKAPVDDAELRRLVADFIKNSARDETLYDQELIKFLEVTIDRTLEPRDKHYEFRKTDKLMSRVKRDLPHSEMQPTPTYEFEEERLTLVESSEMVEHLFLTAKDTDLFDFEQQVGILAGFVKDRNVDRELVISAELSRVFIGSFCDCVQANYSYIFSMCRDQNFWREFKKMSEILLDKDLNSPPIPLGEIIHLIGQRKSTLWELGAGEIENVTEFILTFCVKASEL